MTASDATVAASTSWVERFDELLGRPVGTRSIAVVRIGAGLIAAWYLRPIASDALGGTTFHGRFSHPFWSWLPVASPAVFTVLVVVGFVSALGMSAGVLTRTTSAITTATIGYHLALSTTNLHNNRAYLFAVLLCVSLAPAGRSWSLDRWVRSRRRLEVLLEVMPAWPLWLLRFECSLVYGASGLSKLVDPDWIGGTVTWGRVVTQEAMVRSSVLPEFAQDVLLDRTFHTVAAKLIVGTELFIATGLWWRRTRPWAILTAIVFHVSIELSASVESFSILGIFVLVVWLEPDLAGGPLRRRSPSPSPNRPRSQATVSPLP